MALSMDLSMLNKGGLQGAIDNGMTENQAPSGAVQVIPNTQLQTQPPAPPPEAPNRGTLGVKDSTEGTLTKFGQKE